MTVYVGIDWGQRKSAVYYGPADYPGADEEREAYDDARYVEALKSKGVPWAASL